MTEEIRLRRYTPRSFAQITFDGTQEASIAEALKDARRISRAIAPALKSIPLGVDFSKLGNVRRRDGKICLFVRTALQKSKLRQVLPRVSELIARAGYFEPVEIVIRPVGEEIELRKNEALGKERQLSEESCRKLAAAAGGLDASPLKDALLSLASSGQSRKKA